MKRSLIVLFALMVAACDARVTTTKYVENLKCEPVHAKYYVGRDSADKFRGPFYDVLCIEDQTRALK